MFDLFSHLNGLVANQSINKPPERFNHSKEMLWPSQIFINLFVYVMLMGEFFYIREGLLKDHMDRKYRILEMC